jgi:hypothetical protein
VTFKAGDRTFTADNLSSRSAAELAQEITHLLQDEPPTKKRE